MVTLFPAQPQKKRTQVSAKNTQISAKSTQSPARVHKVGFLWSFKFSNLVAYHHEKIWPGARGMEQTSVNACHIRQSWSFTISCRLTSTQGGNWLEVYYTLKEPKSWYCIVQLLINSSYGSKIRTYIGDHAPSIDVLAGGSHLRKRPVLLWSVQFWLESFRLALKCSKRPKRIEMPNVQKLLHFQGFRWYISI